jgi:four helix bundle protein
VVQTYKELDVWKRSVALTTNLYTLTRKFPDTERYGLISQIRRATTSIAANIAEGWGRGSTGEYVQFLTVARGSLMELETHLIVGGNLHFLTPDELGVASKEIGEIGKMLNGLIGALKSCKARA